MSKIIMEFEKGGKFEVIFHSGAPETAKAIKKALPLEGLGLQGRFGGEEFFFRTPVSAGPENLTEAKFGDVAFNSDPSWQAVCVYYGLKHKSGPFNLFASLAGDMDELSRIGLRIWQHGGERITLKEE